MTLARFLKCCLALPLGAALLLPLLASAQNDDAAYCGRLYGLARKYIAGNCGECRPDLFIEGAWADCQKGKFDSAIPYLEKRLRDNKITPPPRS
jgi:hypothetical protein